MIIEWVLMAEGFGQDSRGALTAIGISQNVLMAQQLPTSTKRGILVRLNELESGQSLSFTFSVVDPDGRVVAAQSARAELGEPRFPGVPAIADIPLESQFMVTALGTYRLRVEVRDERSGDIKEAEVSLHVIEPPERSQDFGVSVP